MADTKIFDRNLFGTHNSVPPSSVLAPLAAKFSQPLASKIFIKKLSYSLPSQNWPYKNIEHHYWVFSGPESGERVNVRRHRSLPYNADQLPTQLNISTICEAEFPRPNGFSPATSWR